MDTEVIKPDFEAKTGTDGQMWIMHIETRETLCVVPAGENQKDRVRLLLTLLGAAKSLANRETVPLTKYGETDAGR